MKEICAVVVTYNRVTILEQCIRQIQKQTTPCDILIVDNDSTDGTRIFAEGKAHEDPTVRYFNTGKNLGGAGGFCYGINMAVSLGYELIWIMDDDTCPMEDALENLLNANRELQGQYGWLSSAALWTDGSRCLMNRQRKTPYRDIDDADGRTMIPSVMASFVSLLLRKQVVLEYGLPISEFFVWGDDWEYTRRISLKAKCYTIPSSRVIHRMKENKPVNIATDTPDRLDRYSYAYRNDVYIYKREGFTGWLWMILKDIWHSVQVLFFSKSLKGSRIKTIWRGFRKGCRFDPAQPRYSGQDFE